MSLEPSERKDPYIIKLNIGGYKYETTMETLTRLEPDSYLSKMFHVPLSMKPLEEGYYFIDRNGESFGFILFWLRNGSFPPISDAVLLFALNAEANFYCLEKLGHVIKELTLLSVKEKKEHKETSSLINVTRPIPAPYFPHPLPFPGYPGLLSPGPNPSPFLDS
jgi:hypothetical protein